MANARPKALPNPFLTALAEDARPVRLKFSSDQKPGLHRRHRGTALAYTDTSGKSLRDKAALSRIRSLAIPPAWTDVWICPDANGHIQATGRDARGRKQYRYHPQWRVERDGNKFDHMVAFAQALPRIRTRVKRDLARRGLPREKVLATVVRLLETTLIRVGNDEYAQTNHSYGLTTIHNRHVRVRGPAMEFHFRGKSGKEHTISLKDPVLAKIVKRCQSMPGQELFAYEDEAGQPRDVTSQDVNDYLRTATGADFTAKDFRTWAGTLLAAVALKQFDETATKAQMRKQVTEAIAAVSQMLGNTPTVCRKSYIHPAIVDAYLEGKTITTLRKRASAKLARLRAEEIKVLMLLQQKIEKPHPRAVRSRSRSRTRGGMK